MGRMGAGLRTLLKLMIRCLLGSLGGVRASGLDKIPRTGGVIIAPNHLSHLDPLLIGALIPRDAWFLATDELFTVPALGPIARRLRTIPIRQDSPDRAALRRAIDVLNRGDALVVFPEGHESMDGDLLPLQAGFVLLAVQSGCPVVPIGIWGTQRALPPREWRPKHAGDTINVCVGDPITTAELIEGTEGRRRFEVGRRKLDRAMRELILRAKQDSTR